MTTAKGIYKKPYGFDVRATARHRTVFKSFPLNTPLRTMKNWQEEQRALIRRTHPTVSRGTFSADVEAFLRLPDTASAHTIEQRTQRLRWWEQRFGPKRRMAVTVNDVKEGLDALDAKPSTKRHYRAVLVMLWEALDGKQAWCPAKEVETPLGSRRVVRAIPQRDLNLILDALPQPLDAMGARVLVLAHTGLPPVMLASITRDHVDWERGTITLPPRKKGAGVDGQVLPVTTRGLLALAAWRDTGADTPFRVPHAYEYFQRLCAKAGVAPRRLYDLRHTFLTNALVALNGNVKAVQGLALHASPQTTECYVSGAASPLLSRAVLDLDQASSAGTKH